MNLLFEDLNEEDYAKIFFYCIGIACCAVAVMLYLKQLLFIKSGIRTAGKILELTTDVVGDEYVTIEFVTLKNEYLRVSHRLILDKKINGDTSIIYNPVNPLKYIIDKFWYKYGLILFVLVFGLVFFLIPFLAA